MSKPKRQRDSVNPKDARIVVRVTPAQLAAMKIEAANRGITVAELARQAISVIAPPK